MNRKKFLKKATAGLGSIIAIPSVLISSYKQEGSPGSEACSASPRETAGPFPIKTPADWVRENIVGDRSGIPLLIKFTIQNVNNNCEPLKDVFVDLWHCDAHGNYSEYGRQLEGNFTNEHFLRGRQTTDANGDASFLSIYPGWYPGRAPHLHLEVLDKKGNSLLVTQVAFPEEVSKEVYASAEYKGGADTSNQRDSIFRNSLTDNMADGLTGNMENGYTLTKIVKVRG